jgi:hypothetical protein
MKKEMLWTTKEVKEIMTELCRKCHLREQEKDKKKCHTYQMNFCEDGLMDFRG